MKLKYSRSLTWHCKISLVKSLINLLLLLVGKLYIIPNNYIKLIRDIVWLFINQGKKSKIKKAALYKSILSGGLNIMHIISSQISQKVMWLKRFLQNRNSIMAQVTNNLYNVYGGLNLLINCNYEEKLLNKAIPTYYKSMLLCCDEIRCRNVKTDDVMWNNKISQ